MERICNSLKWKYAGERPETIVRIYNTNERKKISIKNYFYKNRKREKRVEPCMRCDVFLYVVYCMLCVGVCVCVCFFGSSHQYKLYKSMSHKSKVGKKSQYIEKALQIHLFTHKMEHIAPIFYNMLAVHSYPYII